MKTVHERSHRQLAPPEAHSGQAGPPVDAPSTRHAASAASLRGGLVAHVLSFGGGGGGVGGGVGARVGAAVGVAVGVGVGDGVGAAVGAAVGLRVGSTPSGRIWK